MKTLQLSDVQARKIYPTASPEIKSILENNWSKQFFSQDITDRINTEEDVLAECGETWEQFNHRTQYDTESQKAGKMVELMCQALNQDWVPDWDDANQKKWAPVFYMGAGFRFNRAYYGWTTTNTYGGARLASEKLCKHAGTKFIHVYKKWLNG